MSIVQNKKATHDYFIEERYEAGLVLEGWEVKSIRAGKAQIKEALLIRRIEEAFLELFSAGKLNGTVHTCVGQEFSAVAFAGQVQKDDFIFSNHRCHGHFISYTKDHLGLIAELLGKKSGVCGGIGSSQHLQARNFYSNGIQGGIVPLAAGMALANKLQKDEKIKLDAIDNLCVRRSDVSRLHLKFGECL